MKKHHAMSERGGWSQLWEHPRVGFLRVGFLSEVLGRPDPEKRRRLELAVADVDRELAANLELMSVFDQTKAAVVLENGEFARHRLTLETELAVTYRPLADLYSRIPDTESAMERRGPANSIREEDRLLIDAWEGDARAAQRALREALDARPRSMLAAAVDRLRGILPNRR